MYFVREACHVLTSRGARKSLSIFFSVDFYSKPFLGVFRKGGDALGVGGRDMNVGPQLISHALCNRLGKQRGYVKASAVAVSSMFSGIMKTCYICIAFGLLTFSYGVRGY